MKLTDERIKEVQSETYRKLVAAGYTGGMGGVQWDMALSRAIEAELQPVQEPVAWRYKFMPPRWTYSDEKPNKEFAGDAWERWEVTPLYTTPPVQPVQEPVVITDCMAYSFHNAIGDGGLGESEVEEIKTGLRAAFANIYRPDQTAEIELARTARQQIERLLHKQAERITTLEAEIELLREKLEKAQRECDWHSKVHEHLVVERNHVRSCYDRAVRLITGIHALLYPPRFTDNDGRTWQFKSPLAEEQMQELSDRIRALPDEIAAIDAAMVGS